MPARQRALIVALLLSLAAGAAGAALSALPLTTLPAANRIADLAIHVTALDAAPILGFGNPTYDAEPNPQLGIVTIDDATLRRTGFPLPRSAYAKLLNNLTAAGAKTVAFDIEFLEPSKDPAQDAAFALTLHHVPSVLAFPLNTTTGGRIGEQLPVTQLERSAASIGYNSVDTPGGYLIGQPMQIVTGNAGTHANERLYAFPAAAVGAFANRPVNASAIPTDADGRMLLLPPKISAHQDLATATQVQTQAFAGRGAIALGDALTSNPADLRAFASGALIFVGATAQGLGDFVTTAGRGRIPGLFANARLADQLLRGLYLRAAPHGLDVTLCFALPILLALAFVVMRTPAAIVFAIAVALVYAYVNLRLFVVNLYWFDLIHVEFAMLLGAAAVAAYRLVGEGSARRLVTNLFGMHVSPAIVSDILKNDDPRAALALRGKKVKATVFYSDIRGFTAMSETMSPEDVYAQLNEYFEAMCAIVFAHGGYVDKFIGDCVMAVFSAPYQTPGDARNAVVAAVEQQAKIRELCERWRREGKPEFGVGMGINTGEVVMGNLGASSRMNYTVIGDNVNVAARLYNLANAGEIVISETTYAECRDAIEVEPREPVEVKGKRFPIAAYTVTALKSMSS